MAISKQQLAGALEKKTLTLYEKIKFLEYAERNKTLGCRKLADVLHIGKTATANILKNKKKIRKQYSNFHEKNKNVIDQENTKLSIEKQQLWYFPCFG